MNIKAVLSKVDAGDVKSLVGLGLIAYGIALLSVPWAFIVTGIILLAGFYAREMIEIFGPRRQDRGGSK